MENNNIFDPNFGVDNEPTGRKKAFLIGIVACIVLIILLVFLIMYYQAVDRNTFKLYIDGAQVSVNGDFYFEDDEGNVYVKAKDIASYIGWNYQNGAYGSYTEDINSGYLQNTYEAASISADSNVLKKYIITEGTVKEETSNSETIEVTVYSEKGTVETTELELPILSVNDNLYIPLSCIDEICNCSYSYESYRMYINEMEYLKTLARTNTYSFGYSSVSGIYENFRLLAYGYMVVIDSSGSYGVVSLYTAGQTKLGFKYSEIVFTQNVQEFFVKTTSDTVGVVDFEGNTIISPKQYDNISILNDSLRIIFN